MDAGFLALLKVWNELLNIIVSIFYPEFLTLLKVWSGFLMCFILNVWGWCGGRESVLVWRERVCVDYWYSIQ